MLLTRRLFLGCSAAAGAAVAVPTVIIPKAKEVAAAVENRVEKRRQAIRDREVEKLYDENFATELRPSSMLAVLLSKSDAHSERMGKIWVEKEIRIDLVRGTRSTVFRPYQMTDLGNAQLHRKRATNEWPTLREALSACLAQRDIEIKNNGWCMAQDRKVERRYDGEIEFTGPDRDQERPMKPSELTEHDFWHSGSGTITFSGPLTEFTAEFQG